MKFRFVHLFELLLIIVNVMYLIQYFGDYLILILLISLDIIMVLFLLKLHRRGVNTLDKITNYMKELETQFGKQIDEELREIKEILGNEYDIKMVATAFADLKRVLTT